MDTILDLEHIVRHEVEQYQTPGLKATTYYIEDIARQIFLVMVVPAQDHPKPFKARAVVMARIVNDYVVIDEDATDRPLHHELVRAGIPREKIVLAYAGETLPDHNGVA